MGRRQGLRGPRSLHQYPKTSCLCTIIFVGADSLTEKNVRRIFRPEAAHLSTVGVEIRPEGPISDHRGLITGLRAQPRPRGVGVAAREDGRDAPRLKILDGMSRISRDFYRKFSEFLPKFIEFQHFQNEVTKLQAEIRLSG